MEGLDGGIIYKEWNDVSEIMQDIDFKVRKYS